MNTHPTPSRPRRRLRKAVAVAAAASVAGSILLVTPAAQANLPQLNTPHTAYAGAYHGWGFHEDGCASGVAAAAAFGVEW